MKKWLEKVPLQQECIEEEIDKLLQEKSDIEFVVHAHEGIYDTCERCDPKRRKKTKGDILLYHRNDMGVVCGLGVNSRVSNKRFIILCMDQKLAHPNH